VTALGLVEVADVELVPLQPTARNVARDNEDRAINALRQRWNDMGHFAFCVPPQLIENEHRVGNCATLTRNDF